MKCKSTYYVVYYAYFNFPITESKPVIRSQVIEKINIDDYLQLSTRSTDQIRYYRTRSECKKALILYFENKKLVYIRRVSQIKEQLKYLQ